MPAATEATNMGLKEESEHFSPYRPDRKLYGFVCVVTGAEQPIGRAIVEELAAHGAACIYALHSTSTAPNFSTTHATQTIPYPIAPPSEESILALIDDILNAHGRLDIWALTPFPSSPTISHITSTSPTNVLSSFESNAMPAFFALKYAPAAMGKLTLKREGYANAAPKDVRYGSIIVVTNSAGPSVAESMASHAALGVVKSGVSALRGTGVRINAVTVGPIGTEGEGNGHGEARKIGLEQLGRPVEVARVVGFLASGFSSCISGTEIRADAL